MACDKRIKKKIKESDFSFFLYLLQQSSRYYDDIYRSAIFILADEKENLKLLKKDRQLRNELIEEERKAKKFWFKNDFDSLKGFREFFHELNKSMFFKLSRNYEEEDELTEFCLQQIDESGFFSWKDFRDLQKIIFKSYVYNKTKNEKILVFRDLSMKIKNHDFNEVIMRWVDSLNLNFA